MKMKRIIPLALAFLVMLGAVSCKKKEVKKIAVDAQFAMALFSDTISFKDIIHDMDSTTTRWLKWDTVTHVMYAYYGDTVRNVLSASEFLNDLPDYNFETYTNFSLPPTHSTTVGDTVISNDKFASFPFQYDGFQINEVLLRYGWLSFEFEVTPQIDMLKRLELYSDQMLKNGQPLRIVVDYNSKGTIDVELAGYSIMPDSTNNVNFGVDVTLDYDGHGFDGGDYVCYMSGGLANVMFNTVWGTMEHPLDSLFNDFAEIDFGVNGLTGSAYLPIPTIKMTYNNTFGFGAVADVTTLQLVNGSTGLVTNLLDADMVEITVNPTNGVWQSSLIEGFTDQIDALAGYTRLEFGGELMMQLDENNGLSVSDTSTVDIIADIEMPFAFDINDLQYNDTIDINLSGDMSDVDIDEYFDEIKFYIDYHNNIKLDMVLQAEFLKNGNVIETLFDGVCQNIDYNGDHPGEVKQMEITVTGHKVRNIMRARQMVLKLGVSTPGDGIVYMKDTDDIFLRMKMRTKTTEIEFDDILSE